MGRRPRGGPSVTVLPPCLPPHPRRHVLRYDNLWAWRGGWLREETGGSRTERCTAPRPPPRAGVYSDTARRPWSCRHVSSLEEPVLAVSPNPTSRPTVRRTPAPPPGRLPEASHSTIGMLFPNHCTAARFCHLGPSLEVTSSGSHPLATCFRVTACPDPMATGFLSLGSPDCPCPFSVVFVSHTRGSFVCPPWPPAPPATEADDLRVVGLSLRSHLGRHALLLLGDEVHPLAASVQLRAER